MANLSNFLIENCVSGNQYENSNPSSEKSFSLKATAVIDLQSENTVFENLKELKHSWVVPDYNVAEDV